MEIEQFKPFPLNPLVMVGNLGTIIRPNGKTAKLSKHNLGYLAVAITVSGEVKTMKAHRVIAITWVPNPNNLPTVNHDDGIKTNNRADNLSWMTLSDNHKHAWRTGLHSNHKPPMTGKTHSAETKELMSKSKQGKFRELINGKWYWTNEDPKSPTRLITSYTERKRVWQEKLKKYRKAGLLP